MSANWVYPVELRREHGEVHAYASALPEAIAAGANEPETLAEMREALIAAVRGRIKDGMDLAPPPRPRPEQKFRVELPARLAAKASVYAAWKRTGLSKVALGERLGRSETEVRRILDPDHGTKLDQLEETARALGGRLVVSFEAA
jgi:antitoxin HicB